MLRYFILQKCYPVLDTIARLYFLFVNNMFELIYMLKPKTKVDWTEEELSSPFLFLSAKKAAEKIRKKEISSEKLVSAYIERIRRTQPLINAVVAERFEQALAEAREADRYLASLDEDSEEYKNLEVNKPLFGVPYSNKNNMDVKGFVTVAGFDQYLKNPPTQKDSAVVQRLGDAGAILVALTNLPKLAMDWCCENRAFGRTCNPYDLRRITGGSSGGEGALVAAGASPFGLGNDLAGSVRIPSAMSGLFGLKATNNAVPLEGFVPPIDTEQGKFQWSIGPMCRYAEDLPIVFSIISGRPYDETFLKKVDFTKVRILYMDTLNIWFMEKAQINVLQALKKTVRFFESEFNVTAQKVDFPISHHLYEIWGAEGFGTSPMNIPEIIREIPKLCNGTSQMTLCAWLFAFLHYFVGTRTDNEKIFMLKKLDKLRHQIVQALGDQGILLLPTWPTLAPFHRQNMFTPFNLPFTQLFNVLGFPAVTCPLGLDNTTFLPLSVQIVGPPNSEPLLMAAAMKLEEKRCAGWARP